MPLHTAASGPANPSVFHSTAAPSGDGDVAGPTNESIRNDHKETKKILQ